MRDTTTFAVDVKTELTLRIFGREINFTRWRVEAFGHDNEMMDEFLHLRHDARLRRQHVFPIRDIDRAAWNCFHHLPQNPDALPHLFDPDQISIVTITRAADDHFEVV